MSSVRSISAARVARGKGSMSPKTAKAVAQASKRAKKRARAAFEKPAAQRGS